MKKNTLAPDQLSLGLPAMPTARTARAELVDATRRQPERKLKTFAEWPKPGTRVSVQGMDYLLAGELLGHQYDPEEQRMIGRVRLDADQPGLSESLKASLPRVIETTLERLRKEE